MGKGVPYSRAFINHRGRKQNRRPRDQGPERGASQVPEPAHVEFVRSVGGLVFECGVMRGGIWSTGVHRRRQKEREEEKSDRHRTDRIKMTDRGMDR